MRARVCVCVRARCTVAWQTAVDTVLKRRGLTSRALKTSLIQYFRCRSRSFAAHYRRAPASRRRSAPPPDKPGIYGKWTEAAAAGRSGLTEGKKKHHEKNPPQRGTGREREIGCEVAAAAGQHLWSGFSSALASPAWEKWTPSASRLLPPPKLNTEEENKKTKNSSNSTTQLCACSVVPLRGECRVFF